MYGFGCDCVCMCVCVYVCTCAFFYTVCMCVLCVVDSFIEYNFLYQEVGTLLCVYIHVQVHACVCVRALWCVSPFSCSKPTMLLKMLSICEAFFLSANLLCSFQRQTRIGSRPQAFLSSPCCWHFAGVLLPEHHQAKGQRGIQAVCEMILIVGSQQWEKQLTCKVGSFAHI